MPLFQFECQDVTTYIFSCKNLSICDFDATDEIPGTELFSEKDRQYMQRESKALVFKSDDLTKYKSKVNFLMIAFKLFSDGKSPFIKYRLCKNNEMYCSRILTPITYINEFESEQPIYSMDALQIIDKAYTSILEMDSISVRCHNILYFLYLAFHTTHWIESFTFLMSTLEAIFSKDESGSAVKTICTRVSSFLGYKLKCTYVY